MNPLTDLVALLGRLPGVGERTAMRLAFHILGSDPAYAATLGRAIAEIQQRVHRCEQCGNYGEGPRCSVCLDPKREDATLCVVARIPDLLAIERTGTYRGRYHVLHKLLAPLDGVGPEDLPLDRLLQRVKANDVREVVVATPLSVEGEATAHYLSEVLRPAGVQLSRIASGIPHGGELEFTDQVTLGRAFEGRRTL